MLSLQDITNTYQSRTAVSEHQAILDNIVSDAESATAGTYLSVMRHMDNTIEIVIALMN
ncbi:MAG: hypothetical protein Q4F43_08105 [Eubacteriales bacterium]|nr:hypothetical protein [Eubacteriales bacterium]